MALAYGGPYYMPPANIRRMAADLSALPVWYALPQSEVWLFGENQVQWLKNECPLSLPVMGVSVPDSLYNKVEPWGWSASLAHRLQNQGTLSQLCPDAHQLELIRVFSGRRTAVTMLQHLQMSHTLGCSEIMESVEDIRLSPPFLLKAPWSGSGRGIRKVEGPIDSSLSGWMNRIIKTQGYLVVEPFYQKIVDFAMEFQMDKGVARFMGYSLFETDAHGIYKENLLADDNEIERRLSVYVPLEILHSVRNKLLHLLPDTLNASYEGYLGVDMMICQEDGEYAIHPCVEINLRMNMGIVARLLYDHYVVSGTTGRYIIEYYPKLGDALCAHCDLLGKYPLVVEQNKIRQGYMSLTPVFDDTAYQAYVIID